MRSIVRFAVILGTMALAGCAMAPAPAPDAALPLASEPFVEPMTQLRFPRQLGSYERTEVRRFDDPELGVSIRYRGWGNAEIFVYDLGFDRIATGIDSEAFQLAFDRSDANVAQLTNTPPRRDGERRFASQPTVSIDSEVATLQVSRYDFVLENVTGDEPMSYWLVMTGFKNQFVKLLFTHPTVDPELAQQRVRDFVLDWLDENPTERRHFFLSGPRL